MRSLARACAFGLSLALALFLWSCRSGIEEQNLSTPLVLDQERASSAAPRVSRQFQAEVARLASQGLRLKEALEADLGGPAPYLAAVFERDKPKAPSEAYEFRLIESSGAAPGTIFRRAEFFYSLASAEELAGTNAADINGDGLKEIIVQSSSGGNCWSCNPTEIYRVKNRKAELIAAGPIQKIADLDGNGAAELLVADARWEVYDDLSHAAAPYATIVYAWKDGGYVYASRDFAAHYKGEIEKLRASIEEARSEITAEEFSDDSYVGRAVSLAITYAHAGEAERGVKELEALMNANVRSQAQALRRKQVIQDFRGGESAQKLRDMKHGDRMPLG